ncbi:TPA: hypothetical protein RJ957_002429 [Enterobacter hormaechei]|nr:hypothetical protein [Enterobacter hormaechei]
MNFAIFENFDGSVNASINKKTIVTLFDSMNDNNVIEKLLTVSGKEKQRLLGYISNVLTGNKMISVKAGVFTYNEKPGYVAYSGDKAVMVIFEGDNRKVWKSFSVNLRTQRARPNDTATIMIGNPIEYKEKVNHKADAKITNVYEELQAKIKELEEKLKKSEEQNVEKDKLIDAFVKKENGEFLNMGEEFIIERKMYKASKEVAASQLPISNEPEEIETDIASASNDSTLFIVSNTEVNSNEPKDVCNDQCDEINSRVNIFEPALLTEKTMTAREKRLAAIKAQREESSLLNNSISKTKIKQKES